MWNWEGREVRSGSGRNWAEELQNTLYGYTKFSKERMEFTLACLSIQPPSVDMGAHTLNPSTWKGADRSPWVPGQPI